MTLSGAAASNPAPALSMGISFVDAEKAKTTTALELEEGMATAVVLELSSVDNEEQQGPATKGNNALTRVARAVSSAPAYLWISLAVLCILTTLGVVGSVYYYRSVSASNQQTATDIAATSARALEKLLDGQKAPVVFLGKWISLNPNWAVVEEGFERVAAKIFESYPYYEVEAAPLGYLGAMFLPPIPNAPWAGLNASELLEYKKERLDFGRVMLCPREDCRPEYWSPWQVDISTINPDGHVVQMEPWTDSGEMYFSSRFSVFIPDDGTWDLPAITQTNSSCPEEVCLTPDGRSFWGFVDTIFTWSEIQAGMNAVHQNDLLFSLAPDKSAVNQTFLSHSSTYPSNKTESACVAVNVYDIKEWTLCVQQEGGWDPVWATGLIVGVVALAVLLSVLVFLVLRSRAQAVLFSARQEESNRKLQASTDQLEEEKRRLQTLMVRQYQLINCLGQAADPGSVCDGKRTLKEEIDTIRQSISGADSFSEVQLNELLGQGSFGKVYKGRWNGSEVAVKTMVLPAVMSGEAKREKMAIMEAAISSSLSHPHIVQTYTYSIKALHDSTYQEPLPPQSSVIRVGGGGSECGSLGSGATLGADKPSFLEQHSSVHSYEVQLVLELCDKGSLREVIDAQVFLNSGTLNYKAILDTGIDIAKAMLHLHLANVLHADLKASNVMLKSCGSDCRGVVAKVSDFGLAIRLDSSQTHMSSLFQGTMTHMAPEVLMKGYISKAADVYAFGITLWELFTGGQAFANVHVAHLGHAITKEQQRPMFSAFAPQAFQDLVARCWDPNPDLRPGFKEVLDTLVRLRQLEPGATEYLDINKPMGLRHSSNKSCARPLASVAEGLRGEEGEGEGAERRSPGRRSPPAGDGGPRAAPGAKRVSLASMQSAGAIVLGYDGSSMPTVIRACPLTTVAEAASDGGSSSQVQPSVTRPPDYSTSQHR